MVDSIAKQILSFDHGIDRISYRRADVGTDDFPGLQRVLPSEEALRAQLDAVIYAPSVDDNLRQALSPEITNREILSPAFYGAAIADIRDHLATAAKQDSKRARALAGLSELLGEQQEMRALLSVYRSSLFRA